MGGNSLHITAIVGKQIQIHYISARGNESIVTRLRCLKHSLWSCVLLCKQQPLDTLDVV